VAMTGEITLRGRVLPIGGLKEKVLAAHRGGILKILIPKENEKDLREIPRRIREKLVMVPVESADDVLREALLLPSSDTFLRQGPSLSPAGSEGQAEAGTGAPTVS